jgi:hypothetical protein
MKTIFTWLALATFPSVTFAQLTGYWTEPNILGLLIIFGKELLPLITLPIAMYLTFKYFKSGSLFKKSLLCLVWVHGILFFIGFIIEVFDLYVYIPITRVGGL